MMKTNRANAGESRLISNIHFNVGRQKQLVLRRDVIVVSITDSNDDFIADETIDWAAWVQLKVSDLLGRD